MNEDGKMETICKSVGLKILLQQNVFCPWQFNSDDALQNAFLSTASFVKAVHAVDEELVRETIIRTAQPYSVADGIYFMKNDFTFYIASKL